MKLSEALAAVSHDPEQMERLLKLANLATIVSLGLTRPVKAVAK